MNKYTLLISVVVCILNDNFRKSFTFLFSSINWDVLYIGFYFHKSVRII